MDPVEPNNRSSSVSNLTRESTFRSLSSTQSPPIQLMERPDHYEFEDVCNSSPFSNRCSSSSSSEWSSLSNESLFSIHITNSLTHDQDGFQSGESMKSDDLITFSSPLEPESDLESLKMETSSKLDVPKYNLDEPQKVVRWKTQVERLAEEGAPPEGHKWQPSPFNDYKSNEPANHAAPKPKKKSRCKCSACNMPKWPCSNGCWKSMKCSNCKPKKVSSHSSEARGAKKSSKKGCCGPSFTCFRSWSCSCHCCAETNLLLS